MKRFRCEIKGSRDPWLIARFIRAANAQEAVVMIKNIYGSYVSINVTVDE